MINGSPRRDLLEFSKLSPTAGRKTYRCLTTEARGSRIGEHSSWGLTTRMLSPLIRSDLATQRVGMITGTRRADIEVPNLPIDVSSWEDQHVIPRVTSIR
ncbi:hypothetical protein FNV43_RR11011 [Rhamnella rubrinervis]|uniref:Uncharacterized protein n=1 Tax=Rhamnella rubrinervis TaxID=2594499 RepID=A0A8K0MGV2_9ROSA|nr:hypothetical protein FNV43_RR11011 [Rhamnella rubrinervis]